MHISRNRVAKSVDDVFPIICVSSDSVEEFIVEASLRPKIFSKLQVQLPFFFVRAYA